LASSALSIQAGQVRQRRNDEFVCYRIDDKFKPANVTTIARVQRQI